MRIIEPQENCFCEDDRSLTSTAHMYETWRVQHDKGFAYVILHPLYHKTFDRWLLRRNSQTISEHTTKEEALAVMRLHNSQLRIDRGVGMATEE